MSNKTIYKKYPPGFRAEAVARARGRGYSAAFRKPLRYQLGPNKFYKWKEKLELQALDKELAELRMEKEF